MRVKAKKKPLTYRDQIDRDLTRMAEKWKAKGMPGLAAILVLTADFYNREMEGYLLGVLSSVHRLVSRLQYPGVPLVESRAERPARARTARRRHSL